MKAAPGRGDADSSARDQLSALRSLLVLAMLLTQQDSQRFNVMAIPTLMVLRHGQVAAQRAGAVPAASLRAWVEEVLGN